MGYNRKMTRFRPPPNLRISAPPSRHLPAHPSRRRYRDYAMNFQWIFTILLFALVAPGAFTSISPPRCAGVRWLHVFVFLVCFSSKHACLRWTLLVSRGWFRNHVSSFDRCAAVAGRPSRPEVASIEENERAIHRATFLQRARNVPRRRLYEREPARFQLRNPGH